MKNLPLDPCPVNMSDEDILEAMKEIHGYLDITPGDFKEIYGIAFRHAHQRLARTIRAEDIMTRKVITVERDTPLKDVAEILSRHDISGVPVIDDVRRVAGIISENDFIFHMGNQETRSFMGIVAQCLQSTGCIALTIRRQTAQDIMTSPAVTVSEASPLSEIASLLSEKNIRRVPVVTSDGALKGIISRVDLIQSFCSIEP
ncbi:MAG TPA: CBS domain-containing protein [Deltaproteobacteria bacterium]|nr:CBS domain-containing protein [Deltaproteobacteria bacterium]